MSFFGRPTSAQRFRITALLSRNEFDTRTVTYAYRRLGVAENFIGRPVETWLDSLSIEQASVLIAKLEDL